MKQEILYRITSLIISIVIVLSLCILTYSDKNTYKTIIDIADKIDGLEIAHRASVLKIDNIDIDKALLDKIDELTRQNTVLLQEVASQAHQLNLYEEELK